MKRFVFVAVAGLCSAAPALAQEGPLAPTSPIVPAPVLQSGGVSNPAAGKSAITKFLTAPKWSPLRSPVSASSAATPAPPTGYAPAMLPPPGAVPGAGVALPPGACPDGNCAGHGRSCLQRFKQWLCFQYSCSDLPKCQPTPYITPLQGMFPCTPCGCGGNVGAPPARPLPWPAGGAPAQPQPPVDPNAPPMPQPKPPGGQPLPQPLPLPTGAGVMPPRGTQGAAAAPAGAARATAAPVSVNPNAGRYRAPSWNSSAWKPTSAGPVVTASGTQK